MLLAVSLERLRRLCEMCGITWNIERSRCLSRLSTREDWEKLEAVADLLPRPFVFLPMAVVRAIFQSAQTAQMPKPCSAQARATFVRQYREKVNIECIPPLHSKSLDEEILQAFARELGRPYIPGVHYGDCWQALESVPRRPALLVAYDEYCQCAVGAAEYLHGLQIPGPALYFEGEGNPLGFLKAEVVRILLQRASGQLQDNAELLVLLELLNADGRALCMRHLSLVQEDKPVPSQS